MLTSVEVSGVAMAELSIGSLLWMMILDIVGVLHPGEVWPKIYHANLLQAVGSNI
jgi:hypothetical protein